MPCSQILLYPDNADAKDGRNESVATRTKINGLMDFSPAEALVM